MRKTIISAPKNSLGSMRGIIKGRIKNAAGMFLVKNNKNIMNRNVIDAVIMNRNDDTDDIFDRNEFKCTKFYF